MMTPDLAYLIGFWMGDGSSSSNPSANRPQGVSCLFHCNHEDLTLVKEALVEEGFRSEDRPHENVNVRLINPGQGFVTTLRSLGVTLPCNSHTKQLPAQFLSWDFECRSRLLAGLIDSDGSVQVGKGPHVRGYIATSTRSKTLHTQTKTLLMSLGFQVTEGSYKNGASTEHRCYVQRGSYHEFQRKVRLQPKKQAKLDELCSKLKERALPKGIRLTTKGKYAAYRWENGKQVSRGTHSTLDAATLALETT